MKNMRMVFCDEFVEVAGQKYDKTKVINFLMQERNNAKRKFVTGKEYSEGVIYNFKVDKEVIEVVFFNEHESVNKNYEAILYSWYRSDIRKLRIRLKLLGMALAASLCIYKFYPQIESIAGDIKGFCEDRVEDIKFYKENFSELMAINELEHELRGHTGYGEIEGYEQTVEDHKRSDCCLGADTPIDEINFAIMDYCNENGLGIDVAKQAILKFELFYKEQLFEAKDIDLAEVYRESKEKVKTHQ